MTRPPQRLAKRPLPEDNCAIAVRPIFEGAHIEYEGRSFLIDRNILEGHRFAAQPIQTGQKLLSWGLPFGVALKDIAAGSYVCNQAMLEELRLHNIDIELPDEPNFEDLDLAPHVLDEGLFQPAPPLPSYEEDRFYEGFQREGRGVGTRNCIVLLGSTSRTAAYVRLLDERLKGVVAPCKNIDGATAVAHTEGGGGTNPNNRDLLLRTLAGFMTHPNAGAVLAVDFGSEPVSNSLLRQFMEREGYPLTHVPHHFLSLQGSLQDGLEEGERIVRDWLPLVDQNTRSQQSLSTLKIALQCGGSDAFSGVSGNPLAAWVAKEIIRHGGAANLAETDELIGAESYILDKARDLGTARRFLETVERYKRMAAWHGLTAEGNPSGGNRLRGLYNISLKSIGAAMKKRPEVRLDHVIEYASPMSEAGFHFMDSPGNDLESIAGQVASGSNLIFFTTGNGSITNFPFVPTIKVMTTSSRFRLLTEEMDIDAGRYLDGTPLEDLGRETLDLTIRVASGQATQGEKAGHYQVSIWRDWGQTDSRRTRELSSATPPNGKPIPTEVGKPAKEATFHAWVRDGVVSTELIHLVLPTSLCSVQIARLAAEHLNRTIGGATTSVSRWAALGHTEGCGVAGRSSDQYFSDTMLGCLTHPNVQSALLLEHGCEKMHNAKFRNRIEEQGIDPSRFGFASVQLDGGVTKVLERIEAWFAERERSSPAPPLQQVGIGSLRVGIFSTGTVSNDEATACLGLVRHLLGCGAAVVVPESATLLDSLLFTDGVTGGKTIEASLGYGKAAAGSGLFVMESPSRHAVECLTGLASTGVHLLLVGVDKHPLPSHPLIPVLQFTDARADLAFADDLDCLLEGPPAGWSDILLDWIVKTAGREYVPKSSRRGFLDFQLARGALSFSM